jgi:hypothetical protein
MREVYVVVAVIAIAVNAAAGLWGAWAWWRVRSSTWFWRLLRAGQGVVIVDVALGGVLVLQGHKPSGLHVLYLVLPLGISYLAEQLRIASASMVLEARGYDTAAEVGELDPEEQRAVVLSIVQREIGVMAVAALVIAVLLARAAATAG